MPRRKEKGAWFWRGAIAAMLASVTGLFAIAAFHAPPTLNGETGCRQDGNDPAHTVILIDQSDPFSPNDIGWVQAFLDEEARILPRHGRLSLVTPQAQTPNIPKVVFSQCSPGSPAHANPLVQNPRMIEAAWRKAFFKPLSDEVERLLRDRVDPASPLSESLYAIGDRADFRPGQAGRRIVIVSDLMQHSEDFSFYRSGADWAAFEATPLGQLIPDLEGVEIVTRVVPRQERALSLTTVKAFWKRWFEAAGAGQK